MAEEHRLILTLVPKVDTAALQQAISGTTGPGGGPGGGQNQGGGAGAGGGAPSGGSSGASGASGGSSGASSGATGASGGAEEQARLHNISRLSQLFGRRVKNTASEDKDADADEEKQKKRDELKKKLTMEAISMGTQGIKALFQTSLGLVEDIYKQMRNASPLLQAIESMFNLAVTLFFMPLGNKLGEMLIPATISLLDTVTELWDSFEGKTLGEAVAWAIEKGTQIFGQYIENIATTLDGQQGVVGSMSRFLHNIADFVQHRLDNLLEGMLNLAGWLLEHFKTFVSLYVSISTAQLGATMGSGLGPLGPILGAVIGGGAGFGISYAALSALGIPGYAEGGKVSARDGGQLILAGEAGEDEYIVPSSKAASFADAVGGSGGITNNWYISGVTAEELADLIDDRISRQISRSRIQGGF